MHRKFVRLHDLGITANKDPPVFYVNLSGSDTTFIVINYYANRGSHVTIYYYISLAN